MDESTRPGIDKRCAHVREQQRRLLARFVRGRGPMLEVATAHRGRPAVRGALDLLSTPALEAWLTAFDGQFTEIDLSGVTLFDSCALRVLLSARRRQPNIRIVAPSAAVLKVL